MSNPLLVHDKVIMPYLFGERLAPWFWSYPYYCTHLDYSRMYMQPYFIQYPSTCPSNSVSQKPIVASNNLVNNKLDCSKDGEKSIKRDNQYLHSRWCPSGLSHTQKRRLQRMRKESMEQQVEVVPARSATTKQVWRPKCVVSSSA
jgi:hypothetical protein